MYIVTNSEGFIVAIAATQEEANEKMAQLAQS